MRAKKRRIRRWISSPPFIYNNKKNWTIAEKQEEYTKLYPKTFVPIKLVWTCTHKKIASEKKNFSRCIFIYKLHEHYFYFSLRNY